MKTGQHRYASVAAPNRYPGDTFLRTNVDERSSNAADLGPALRANNVDQHTVAGIRIGDIKRDVHSGLTGPTPQGERPNAEGVAFPKKVRFPISMVLMARTR